MNNARAHARTKLASWIQDEMFPTGPATTSQRLAVEIAEELQGRRGFRQNRFDDPREGELLALAADLTAAIERGAAPLDLAAIVDPETPPQMIDEDVAELTDTLTGILEPR